MTEGEQLIVEQLQLLNARHEETNQILVDTTLLLESLQSGMFFTQVAVLMVVILIGVLVSYTLVKRR